MYGIVDGMQCLTMQLPEKRFQDSPFFQRHGRRDIQRILGAGCRGGGRLSGGAVHESGVFLRTDTSGACRIRKHGARTAHFPDHECIREFFWAGAKPPPMVRDNRRFAKRGFYSFASPSCMARSRAFRIRTGSRRLSGGSTGELQRRASMNLVKP